MKMDRELMIPEVADEDGQAVEILRAWIAKCRQHVSMRVGIWEDPHFGECSSQTWQDTS